MRLIDADALVEKLKKLYTMAFAESDSAYHSAYRSLAKIVEDAPTVGEWVPCSERVPDEAKVVLACNKNGIMMVGHIFVCHNGECQAYTNDDEMDWVIAWMPLPEPFITG